MKRIFVIVLALLGYSTVFSVDIPKEVEQEILNQSNKFKDILETTYLNYVDSVDVKKMSEIAFSAMLKDLDPHSMFFSSDYYKKINDLNQGKSCGTGVSLFLINDTLTVISVTSGCQADSLGIKTGDKLLFIDGENALKMTSADASAKLNGQAGSSVSIITKRSGVSSLNEYKIVRSEVLIPSINTYFIVGKSDVGYIKLSRFSKTTDSEFHEALMSLDKKGMKHLVVDLRGNQGGLLDQVAKLVDEFLPEGKKITYTKGRNPDFTHEIKSTGNGKFQKLPIVVLIDEVSASASEIFAGVMQDLDRGIVVGQISFGKGLVQKAWNFKDGSAFQLTVAHYYTPSGRMIQKIILKDSEKPTLDAQSKLSLDPKVQKQIEQLMERNGNRLNMPVFHSEKGRPVIGGGGIVPDYFEKEDTTTLLTNYLKSKGVFLENGYSYLARNGKEIEKRYGDDFLVFVDEFKIDDAMVNDFVALSKARKIWNEQMYQIDKEYIRYFIKAAIAHAIWGDPAFYAVMFDYDRPAKRATELVRDAEKMTE